MADIYFRQAARKRAAPVAGSDWRAGNATAADELPNRGAIILGGDVGALGVARSLGRAGIPVVFLPGPNRVASYSQYVTRTIDWPGPLADGACDWLIDLAQRDGLCGWVLMPAADADVRLIAHHHGRLSRHFRLVTPPWEDLRWAADKHLTYARAADLGIPHPRTYTIRTVEEANSIVCQFPLILKPAEKEGVNALTRDKVWRAADRQELVRLFAAGQTLAGAGGLIVQELIPGEDANQFSYCAACRGGEPVVSMTARRTRQAPAGFGTGTYVESLGPMPFEADAERFLRSIGYTGMVEMEFKLDTRDGLYKLLDVNPRIWTWNALGPEAGVDFALAVWAMSCNQPVTPARARAGASWIYVARDFREAMTQLRQGSLPLKRYLASLVRGKALFAADDPVPALMDIPLVMSRRRRNKA